MKANATLKSCEAPETTSTDTNAKPADSNKYRNLEASGKVKVVLWAGKEDIVKNIIETAKDIAEKAAKENSIEASDVTAKKGAPPPVKLNTVLSVN